VKKLVVAAVVAAGLIGASAPSAPAAEPVAITGPCATQQALFEKYNIQIDMYAPAASWLYGTICGVTDDQTAPAPCAGAWFLMEKYGIELGMHSEELSFVLRTVCGVTG
jgi:hypothetical protein